MTALENKKIEAPVKFSPEAQQKFEKILTQYDSKRSSLLPVLHLAQDEFGYCSDAVVEYVSQIMELSPAQVMEVVSFYTMYHRKPTGQNHFAFCMTLSCWMGGTHQLYKNFCARFGIKPGEVTPDGKFSVGKMECLGSCGTAPMLSVNETYYESMTPEKLNRLIESCRKGEPEVP